MTYLKHKKIWFHNFHATYKRYMIFQRLHHLEVLRNNPCVKNIHKNHKLATLKQCDFYE